MKILQWKVMTLMIENENYSTTLPTGVSDRMRVWLQLASAKRQVSADVEAAGGAEVPRP